MENETTLFEDIIESVSLDDLMKPYKKLSGKEVSENNENNLSVEEQKFYLAYYARMATEHVGFENFSKENQEAFKSHIVEMYKGIDGARKQGDFLREMGQSAKFIEDKHFEIGIGRGEVSRGGGEKRERTVGKNFCYRTDDERPKGYEKLGGASMVTESGEHVPTWEIGILKKNGEDILVVSVFDIMHRGNDYEEWKDFIEKFDEVYGKDKEKWEKGRIILDVRGNRGGEDKPIDHMAKRLYGNLVNTYKRCEVKDSSLGYHLYQQHGSVKNAKKLGQEPPKREHFSGKNKALFDETGVYYAFNEEKGYKGRIDILTCARVGSSAESAYSSFYHHPNVRYIGENTAGMQQYVQGTFATPWGGEMRVGWGKLTYWDKEGENIEVKGHKPDVECKSKDAFDVALEGDRDYGRVMGFRELNEEVKGEIVIKDYDPKLVSDPSRKAYYSLQTFPAMEKLEAENSEIEARKFNGEDAKELNDVLNDCMKKIKENELGNAILIGAGYGEKTTAENFSIEEIYIGNKGRTKGGHCGLISNVKDGKDPNNARGEIYLNEEFVRNTITNLGKENAEVYLANIVVHEFLHGNQRRSRGIENKVENCRSGLFDKKSEQSEKLSDEEKRKGYARMFLVEAASMSAGLTVCMQVCDDSNRDKILDYALKDTKELGNVSGDTIDKLRTELEKMPKTSEERELQSLALFEILVKGQMDYFSKQYGGKNLGIELGKYDDLLDAVYHKELFGENRDKFNKVIENIDNENGRAMEAQNAMGRVSDIINKKKENEAIKPKEPLQKEVNKGNSNFDMNSYVRSNFIQAESK